MATKLRNMRLTSVDLVRAGANQEADICLFKSATPPEAAESPTEPEKNIFKRFIAWLRENPAEAATEPHSPVEKADEPADLETIYKTALAESIHSIYSDSSLTDIEKASMVEESIEQFQKKNRELFFDDDPDDDHDDDHDLDDALEEVAEDDPDRFDEIEEVHKFNHNHAADGKFTTSSGGGGSAKPVLGFRQGGAHDYTRATADRNAMAYDKPKPKLPSGEKVTYTQTNPKKPEKPGKFDPGYDPFAGMKFTSPEIERARNEKYRRNGPLFD